MAIKVCIAHSNVLFCEGIGALMKASKDCDLLFTARNSSALLERLQTDKVVPEICLVDLGMISEEGENPIKKITKLYPGIKSIALFRDQEPEMLIPLLECGIKAHVPETSSFQQLLGIINQVYHHGYFYDAYLNQAIDKHFRRTQLADSEGNTNKIILTPREKEFVLLCCSDLQYKEIAVKMGIKTRTVEKFREMVFAKLETKTRMGVVMHAVNSGLYETMRKEYKGRALHRPITNREKA